MRARKQKSLWITFVLLTVLLLGSVLQVAAGVGEEITIGDYQCYEWNDGSVDIYNYTGTDSVLTIPAELEGKRVDGTSDDFTLPNHVTKVVVKNGVKYVALSNSKNVTEIILPDSLTALVWDDAAESAFYKNQGNWNNHALYAGKWLIDIEENYAGTFTIPDGTVGANYFLDTKKIEKIVFPGSMKNITLYTHMPAIKEVVFSEGVAEIEMYIEISEVSNLTGLWFPDSVANIFLNIPEAAKPVVYCSENNQVAIEYAKQHNLPVKYVFNCQNDSNISIVDERKVLADGTRFFAKKVIEGKEYNNAKETLVPILGNNKKLVLMNMSLLDSNNNEIHQLNGVVSVMLDVPVELSGVKEIKVYRVENGACVECVSTIKDGKITFQTDHFSTYAFVGTLESTNNTVTSPKTGDNGMTTSLCMLLMAVICGGSAFDYKKKRR